MQFSKTIILSIAAVFMTVSMGSATAEPSAKGKASYTEAEFLSHFSGKSRQVVMEKLGNPVKKEQAVKPSNAAGVLGGGVDTSKPVNVEMWYYSNLVNYEPKKKYKSTELTFVNDRCMNIAFFNNK